MLYILDAHNIIHKSPHLRQALSRSVDDARKELIALAERFSARYPSYTIKAVFDGYSGEIYSRNPMISIIFSGTSSADDKIMKIIKNLKNTSLAVAVSSDNEIYNFARMHYVQAQLSEQFLSELDEALAAHSPEKPAAASSDNIDMMLELFGLEKKAQKKKTPPKNYESPVSDEKLAELINTMGAAQSKEPSKMQASMDKPAAVSKSEKEYFLKLFKTDKS